MTEAIKRPANHPRINAVEVALKYAQDVLNGTIVAGMLVKCAAKRFLDDLREGHERGLEFRAEAAQHVVDFFGFLKHSKGEWGGDSFKLEPWQVFILANLFGWYTAAGVRRFNEVYIEIARKNGKTTFIAGIGLYLLLMDDEPGAEVYCAATKKDQARLCFDEAARMRKASKFLAARIVANGTKTCNNMNVPSTNSKYEPLSSEDDTLDGLNVHGALIDELHAHPDRKLYDVLFEATKARRQPLVIAITTAGYDRNGVCWKQRDFGSKIVEGIISNVADKFKCDNVFAFIACLDDGDVWDDEKNWPKANPNLGVSVKLDKLKQAAAKAVEDPTARNSFLRKHLNIWTSQDVRWMPPEKWAACCTAPRNSDVKKLREAAIERLKGRLCYGGLDLSSKIDLASFYLIFPPSTTDKIWHVLGWNWVPELNVPDRVAKDKVPYDVWLKEGYLYKTDGNVIDQDVIQEQVNAARKQFRLEECGFDSWNNTQLSVRLQSDGVKMMEARQGFRTFSEPMKEMMAMVLSKRVEHYRDPILAWAMDNVAATQDPAGNIKPDKDKAKEKIDPAVALLMALARAVSNPAVFNNPYNKRGIVFI